MLNVKPVTSPPGLQINRWAKARPVNVNCLAVLYIDVSSTLKASAAPLAALAVFAAVALTSPAWAQNSASPAGPPENAAIFPLSQVHRGLTGTAWTVFQGIYARAHAG